MDVHEVTIAKSSTAIRALARAIDQSILNASFTKDVAACLDDGVLDLVLANLALQHRLRRC